MQTLDTRLNEKVKCCATSFFTFLFLLSNFSFAQQQVVRGKITDNQSQNELIGATVSLYKDSVVISQTSTDVNGNYRIDHVPIGTYRLKASYVGYIAITTPK